MKDRKKEMKDRYRYREGKRTRSNKGKLIDMKQKNGKREKGNKWETEVETKVETKVETNWRTGGIWGTAGKREMVCAWPKRVMSHSLQSQK